MRRRPCRPQEPGIEAAFETYRQGGSSTQKRAREIIESLGGLRSETVSLYDILGSCG